MFKDIEITTDGYENITLFDTHGITIHRKGESNNAELVIHPCATGKLSIRFAKEPYQCHVTLANGDDFTVDLGDSDDWGNIQGMTNSPGEWFREGKGKVPADWDRRIGWGNDSDGHVEIVDVELADGFPHGTDIPLEEFKQDVADFLIYHGG